MEDLFGYFGEHFIKIFTSLVCGAAIGLEREWYGKAAGLRTTILICMGAALYMIVSDLVTLDAEGPADPGRIAAQVVTGIGFIGAGSIIRSGGSVAGLTTAATIWIVAAIGLVCGAGYPLLAVMITIIVLLVLLGLGKLELLTTKGNSRGKDIKDEDS